MPYLSLLPNSPATPRILLRQHAGALALLLLVGLSLLLPPVAQPTDLYVYADQRMFWGLPRAMDVLSNLPFALAGVVGLWLLWRLPVARLDRAGRGLAALFLLGLIGTALGSGWYHLQPDDTGLALDRLGMALAFTGAMGLAVAGRVGSASGLSMAAAAAVTSAAGIAVCWTTGNVLPWSVLQGFGVLLLLIAACTAPLPHALPVRWSWVVGLYALAKALELADHTVFDLTGQAVSGHTLKHLVAAAAALPVLMALHREARAH